MTVTIYYLQMLSPDALIPQACPTDDVDLRECVVKNYRYNRFLYQLVGEPWSWQDKLAESDQHWQAYAESDSLRTWVLYQKGSPIGYFELLKSASNDEVQIAYFGLAPGFYGKGLGGYLLTEAITAAWQWQASLVWVHTCTLDHPAALANYQRRGMTLYRQEEENC